MVLHGFYQQLGRSAYPQFYRNYWREQASRGLTTAAPSASDAYFFDKSNVGRGLAIMIEQLMDDGLARAGQPLLVVSCTGDMVTDARPYATRDWPEIVVAGQENPCVHDFHSIMREKTDANKHGLRNSTTTCGTATLDRFHGEGSAELGFPRLGEASDIWIVQGKTFRADTNSCAAEMGKEVWSYFCDECTDKPEVTRYYSGLWAWARGVKQCLLWAYQHDAGTYAETPAGKTVARGDRFTYAVPMPNGSVVSQPGYLGFVEGIRDCRVLEEADASPDPEVKAYLDELRPKVAMPMARRFVGGPPLDSDKIRADLIKLLPRHGYATMGEYMAGHQRAKEEIREQFSATGEPTSA